MRSTILFFAASAIALTFANSFAQTPADTINQKKFVIKAVRIHGNVKLTGRLTDPRWKLASRAELNYEIQPGDNTPAPQKTTVLTMYNSRYIYFGFICHDTDPSKIRAHVTERDNAFDDDFVGVIFDTYDDHQRAYEVFENPYGVQMDGLRNGNNEDMSFDMIWKSKAALNDSGYTAVMAIPFQSLRFPAKKVQNWGIDFLRNIPRLSRIQVSWVSLDLNDPCLLCQTGTLEGLKGLQSTGSVELLPYAMALESGSIKDNSNPTSGFSNGPVTGRLGIGMKFSPNPSLSLQAVINPDFSQVESDAAQISVNDNFALFYPEKRPFFMDGSDIFSTLIQAYYSRTINDPLAAAKVIEKAGPLSVAYLGAENRNSPFIVAGEEGSVADNNGNNTFSSPFKSFSNILRARYNIGVQSFVGALATTRNFTQAHNYVGGFDWSFFFHKHYTFDGQFLLSNTRELNDTSLVDNPSFFGNTVYTKAFDGQQYNGTGFESDFKIDFRNYAFKLNYKDFSPTFQAQDGYVFQNDERFITMDNTVQFYPDNHLVDNWGFDLISALQFNYQGARKQRFIIPDLFINLKSQTGIYVNYLLVNDELYHSVGFTGVHRWHFGIQTSPSSSFTFGVDASAGRFIYRADQTAIGRGYDISAEMIVKPTEKLSFTIDYSRSRLSNMVGGELLFDGYISRVVAVYQFSNRAFVRLIGQYDQFQKQLEIDPLFSYKLNAFTIFYVGSTHSADNYGEPYGFVQTGRQFFLKLQYLWRD